MYNEKELELLKSVFAENEELLILMRKLFFGVDISEKDKEIIKSTFKNKELIRAVKHKIYGLNDFDTPIGQLSDFWMGAESQVFGQSKETIEQTVKSKEMIFSMFEQAMGLLTDPSGEKVDISLKSFEEDELQISLIARNLYMKAIDSGLLQIFLIAGKKEETIEETMKRLTKDSAK